MLWVNVRVLSRRLQIVVLSLVCLCVTPSILPAQGSGFYAGKTVRIVVGTSPGGSFDIWARILAQYLSKHIAGNPAVIVQNMGGAGSLIAANYVYNVANQDGTTLLVPLSIYLNQIVADKEVKFDVRKFNWIGSQAKEQNVLYMRADSPYKTIDQITKSSDPPKCGATGVGSSGYIIPKMMNEVLGLNLQLVTGYQGGKEIDLAVERGEIHCRGITISAHFGREPFDSWHSKGFDLHLLQTGDKRDSRVPEAPTIYELMDTLKTTDMRRRAVRVLVAGGEFYHPIATGPGVPADRISMLRDAFSRALKDPELLAKATAARLETNWSTGEQVQSIVNELMDQPKEVFDIVRTVLVK
jgi:tripartite-type tricarboxylate transporter receptor subunit TctC